MSAGLRRITAQPCPYCSTLAASIRTARISGQRRDFGKQIQPYREEESAITGPFLPAADLEPRSQLIDAGLRLSRLQSCAVRATRPLRLAQAGRHPTPATDVAKAGSRPMAISIELLLAACLRAASGFKPEGSATVPRARSRSPEGDADPPVTTQNDLAEGCQGC